MQKASYRAERAEPFRRCRIVLTDVFACFQRAASILTMSFSPFCRKYMMMLSTLLESENANPALAMSSLEAYGIDVAQLAKQAGMKYINGVNTVTYFGAVFFG